MMEKISGLLATISGLLLQLRQNEKRLNKRLLNKAFKNYKKIKKLMKEDGVIDAKEQNQLEELKDRIIEAQYKLIEF